MGSRYYTFKAYALHVFGQSSWQHEWRIYGTESQAHVQGTRMVREGWFNNTADYEVIPVTGKRSAGTV
jgi:hypothetical protein